MKAKLKGTQESFEEWGVFRTETGELIGGTWPSRAAAREVLKTFAPNRKRGEYRIAEAKRIVTVRPVAA